MNEKGRDYTTFKGEISKRSRANLKPRERSVRSDKRPRVNCSLDHETHKMLQRLSAACRAGGDDTMTKTAIVSIMVASAVRNPQFVLDLQDRCDTPADSRLTFLTHFDNGQVIY